MRDLEQVGEIRIAGAAELVVVALGRDFVGAAEHPGIFRGAVLAELFEELLEASVELANGAVAVEAQRDFVRRRHGLVYAGKGASCEKRWMSFEWSGKVLRTLRVKDLMSGVQGMEISGGKAEI